MNVSESREPAGGWTIVMCLTLPVTLLLCISKLSPITRKFLQNRNHQNICICEIWAFGPRLRQK